VGDVQLDAARHLVRRANRELSLTLKEFAVLRYLMGRPDHLVSAEELLEHVWDENADPFTQTVRVTVGTLRRKLSVDEEPQLLETVIGRGYRLRDLSAVG
jgi:DNA-binding response OmpR family regulator